MKRGRKEEGGRERRGEERGEEREEGKWGEIGGKERR